MENYAAKTKVYHPNYGEGYIHEDLPTSLVIFFERGGKVTISKSNDDLEFPEEEDTKPTQGISTYAAFERLLTGVLDRYNALEYTVEMGEKWIDGTLVLQPKNSSLQSKEIPIEAFFHKIVMLRDRLRVLEQSINSHKVLSDEDKVNLQQYITRCYGSLTTFNIMFSEKDDFFVGVKTK